MAAIYMAVNSFRKVLYSGRTRVSIPREKLPRFEIWCQGIVDALNELEQSQYCARQFAQYVKQPFIASMSVEELDHYRRFVYFYKNGLIRLFSVLDKLGYFMNELFGLGTERIKPKFSYFTVLRNMRQHNKYSWLEQQLTQLKNEHRKTLDLLRNQRNMEIHFINVEMMDELLDENRRGGNRIKAENAEANMKDLEQGCHVAFQAAAIIFTYISKK